MDPLNVVIDTAARQVFVLYQSQPTFPEWKATIEQVFHDSQFRPGFSFLFDRTAIHLPATTDYITDLADFIDQKQRVHGDARWAFVVADLGSFGMGRMLEQITKSENCIRTFRNMDEARFWLARAA